MSKMNADRELFLLIQRMGIPATLNTERYIGNGQPSPNISAEFLGKKLHILARQNMRLKLREAIWQAESGANISTLPVVIHAESDIMPWLITFKAESFFKAFRDLVNPSTFWVSEYSSKQDSFHIETLADALEKNKQALLHGDALDYLPFAISASQESASHQCDIMRNTLNANNGGGCDDE